jgi:hypothetical protein
MCSPRCGPARLKVWDRVYIGALAGIVVELLADGGAVVKLEDGTTMTLRHAEPARATELPNCSYCGARLSREEVVASTLQPTATQVWACSRCRRPPAQPVVQEPAQEPEAQEWAQEDRAALFWLGMAVAALALMFFWR